MAVNNKKKIEQAGRFLIIQKIFITSLTHSVGEFNIDKDYQIYIQKPILKAEFKENRQNYLQYIRQ